MATYQAPLRDMKFVLHELLDAEREFAALPGFEEVTRDLIDPVLEEAAKLCENVVFPLNRTGDQEGCTFEDGTVRTPSGFRDAYRTSSRAVGTDCRATRSSAGRDCPAPSAYSSRRCCNRRTWPSRFIRA